MLPVLDLAAGREEAPAEEWGLHPFFERLLREQRSPGQKVGVPLLVHLSKNRARWIQAGSTQQTFTSFG